MISPESLEVMQHLALEELELEHDKAAYHLFVAIGLLSMKELASYSPKRYDDKE